MTFNNRPDLIVYILPGRTVYHTCCWAEGDVTKAELVMSEYH